MGVEPVCRIRADAVGFHNFDTVTTVVVTRCALASLPAACGTEGGFAEIRRAVSCGVRTRARLHQVCSTFTTFPLADELAARWVELAILTWANQSKVFVGQKAFGLKKQLSSLHEGLPVIGDC